MQYVSCVEIRADAQLPSLQGRCGAPPKIDDGYRPRRMTVKQVLLEVLLIAVGRH